MVVAQHATYEAARVRFWQMAGLHDESTNLANAGPAATASGRETEGVCAPD